MVIRMLYDPAYCVRSPRSARDSLLGDLEEAVPFHSSQTVWWELELGGGLIEPVALELYNVRDLPIQLPGMGSR